MSANSAGRRSVRAARRIVVKVGSGVLTQNGSLRRSACGQIARQICTLWNEGRQVALVSSGAIAMGSLALGRPLPRQSIPERQAAAAVGQIGLSNLYEKRFARYGRRIAQVLLTRTGLQDRERFLNARHTLHTLLKLGVVPIVNENDTVATEEIRFGDNDNLSATVVNLLGAELLVIATDVDGLHHEPPAAGGPRAPLFDVIERITPEVERAARGSSSAFGRGGMTTKLEAARAAARCGASTVLCNGLRRDAVLRAARGESVGTLFITGSRMASRKHWLAFTTRTRGELVLDDGAVRALVERGKSLLPAGVMEVRGKFSIGDPVTCIDARGREVARGLVAYSSEAVARVAGLSTRKVAQVLGYSNGAAIVHRDDLVLLEDREQT